MAAHGDSKAFDELYIVFLKKCKIIIRNSINLYSNFPVNSVDFHELIDKTFMRLLADYDCQKGSFSTFLEYVLENRFASKVKEMLFEYCSTYAPEFELDGTAKPIEQFQDPNQIHPYVDTLLQNFKFKMASSNRHPKNSRRRKRRNVLLMLYAGYSPTEIAKLLNMTLSQVRTLQKSIKDDEEMNNLKLELK